MTNPSSLATPDLDQKITLTVGELVAVVKQVLQSEREAEQLLTIREACEIAGFCYSHFITLKSRGLIEYTMINGQAMVSRREALRQKSLKGKHSKL